MGVLETTALLFWVCIRAPNFWKLPSAVLTVAPPLVLTVMVSYKLLVDQKDVCPINGLVWAKPYDFCLKHLISSLVVR